MGEAEESAPLLFWFSIFVPPKLGGADPSPFALTALKILHVVAAPVRDGASRRETSEISNVLADRME